MSWYDTLANSAPVVVAGLLGISVAVYSSRHTAPQAVEQVKDIAQATQAGDVKGKMAQTGASVMSPPAPALAAPKLKPISYTELAKFDGSDASQPVYVAIKGRVFDVTPKREMYAKGQGYNVFAGKDASRGLGMSSLDPKDAIADYEGLDDAQMRTLNQWESFFEKRYNIVGTVKSE